eukprot:CAMPEP_0177688230 /NCGR_PEP_ID=MMETSP0447-20121125/34549_1 /TAXON_ID=0 /ORGANISM="Stygamoeba regulata, Strain BSH-02190019" /LENGTH=476 /DNA_ID=CAMNT_0019198521 /DNA_START=18 /DNA_END=1445 /DNA_ORIENTATION=-
MTEVEKASAPSPVLSETNNASTTRSATDESPERKNGEVNEKQQWQPSATTLESSEKDELPKANDSNEELTPSTEEQATSVRLETKVDEFVFVLSDEKLPETFFLQSPKQDFSDDEDASSSSDEDHRESSRNSGNRRNNKKNGKRGNKSSSRRGRRRSDDSDVDRESQDSESDEEYDDGGGRSSGRWGSGDKKPARKRARAVPVSEEPLYDAEEEAERRRVVDAIPRTFDPKKFARNLKLHTSRRESSFADNLIRNSSSGGASETGSGSGSNDRDRYHHSESSSADRRSDYDRRSSGSSSSYPGDPRSSSSSSSSSGGRHPYSSSSSSSSSSAADPRLSSRAAAYPPPASVAGSYDPYAAVYPGMPPHAPAMSSSLAVVSAALSQGVVPTMSAMLSVPASVLPNPDQEKQALVAFKHKVSSVVLKTLNEHLKKKRISKDQYKGLAKKLTHELCDKQYRRHHDYVITPGLDSAVKAYT